MAVDKYSVQLAFSEYLSFIEIEDSAQFFLLSLFLFIFSKLLHLFHVNLS